MKQFLSQLYEVYKPLRRAVLGILGFIAISQILGLIGPYFQSKVVDGLNKGLVTKVFSPTIYWFIFASLGVWLFRVTVFRLIRERYELDRVDYAIPERMQQYTLEKLFSFSIGQHTSENSGIKQSIVSRGESALENMLQLFVYQALPLILEVVILTGVLLWWALPIGLVVLGCLLVSFVFVYKLNVFFRKDFKEIERRYIQDSKFEGEVVRNIGLVMALAQETRATKECRESLAGANSYARAVWMRFIYWASLRDTLPQIARAIAMTIAARGVMNGTYSIGQLVMFFAWTTNALGNLGEMSSLHRQMIRAYISIKRYFDMLAIEPDVKVLENPVRPEKFLGRIEFKDITFRYRGRDAKGQIDPDDDEPKPGTKKSTGPALDNVSFIIEAGQTVAFVGESGAGKSTIVNALLRAQDPEHGQILIDGNDLRVIDLRHFRESIGIVNQDVTLFDQTLRYNIVYGLNGRGDKVSDHELHSVAGRSRIDRFMDRLEKGFDTYIGERGVKLSGGERQRVGIARALIKEPDILIFDEATSNLDSENEAMIRESIEKASQGRTTIIIAHRFSTIKHADKVFVFDKGKLVGQGSHAELLQGCPEYQRLVKNQMELVASV